RFTIRTVPALLSRSKAWMDYCDCERPLEQAIKRLGRSKLARSIESLFVSTRSSIPERIRVAPTSRS
ncbi:MAG: hypothetical protein M3178_16985, partial [Pseudomonadota bacterium]|nr:hypothetical protein [Pseudomonadota bacterium]